MKKKISILKNNFLLVLFIILTLMYSKSLLFFNRKSPLASQSNKPIRIPIGNFLFDKTKKIYLETKDNYSIITVLARSRYGKSALLKMIAHQLWLEGRKIIVFDPFGEWAKTNEYNMDVKFPDKIFNIKVVSDFAFRISEMTDEYYWAQLGFTGKAIKYLMDIARHVELYSDDPTKFFNIVASLPNNPADVRAWNSHFSSYPDMHLETHLHKETWRNIQETAKFVKSFFYYPGKDTRQNVLDWEEILELNQFIVFDFGVTEDKRHEASLKSAIVLDKIGFDQIEKYHPCIFVEEADYFIPSKDQMPYSYSREKFDHLNRKKLRKGLFIFYINQVHDTLGETVTRDKFQMILGAIKKTDSVWNELSRNYYRLLQTQRVFLYKNEKGQEFPFVSGDCKVGC